MLFIVLWASDHGWVKLPTDRGPGVPTHVLATGTVDGVKMPLATQVGILYTKVANKWPLDNLAFVPFDLIKQKHW